MKLLFKIVGFGLIGLLFVGIGLQIAIALRDNQPFYGVNYKGLAIGTYSTLAMLVMIAIILLAAGAARLWRAWRRRRDG